MKNFILRRTQKGGHNGGGGKTTVAKAVLNYLARQMIRFLDGGSGKLVEECTHNGGRERRENQALRQAACRKRKREREQAAGGVDD